MTGGFGRGVGWADISMGAGIDIGGTISGRFGALRESGLLLIGVSRKHGTAEGVQQCRVPCPVCCSHYVVG